MGHPRLDPVGQHRRQSRAGLVDFAAAHGGAPGAFNGDLLSDTTPDCCREHLLPPGPLPQELRPLLHHDQRKGGGKNVSFTLTPPRDNLMSYFFWGAPQKLTAKQKAAIQETLKNDRRRILIEPPCWPDFHRVPIGRFQLCFDYWRNRGLEPQTLSCTESNIAGSFQSGPRMPVWAMLTSADYQKRFDEYSPRTCAPRELRSPRQRLRLRYTGIWLSVSRPPSPQTIA